MARKDVLAALAAVLATCCSLAACGPTPPSAASSPGSPSATPTPPAGQSAPPGSPSPGPTATFSVPATGFAFDAESVVGYYRSIGYTCDAPEADVTDPARTTQACRLVDPDGRTRTIGLVSDADGGIVHGFASMGAAPGEDFLDPGVALESLAGFLGAMVGEERGTALVPWLAGHLGDARAETSSADLRVATTADGGTVLSVEVSTVEPGASPLPSPAA